MKRIWLVYEQGNVARNAFFIHEWMEAGRALSAEIILVLYEDLRYGLRNGRLYADWQGREDLPDAAVLRVNQPLLSAHLEAMGIPVFNNARVAAICNDKRATHQAVSHLVHAMDTVFLHGDEQDSPLPYPVVVKAAHSCGGRQVYLAANGEEFRQALRAIYPDSALAQALCDTPGRDVRAYVMGREIIAVLMRYSEHDFRSNIGQGGSAVPYALDAQTEGLVRRIALLFDFGLAGIDFLMHRGRLVFNEIEDAVGTRMLFANGHADIVRRYLAFILNNLERKT